MNPLTRLADGDPSLRHAIVVLLSAVSDLDFAISVWRDDATYLHAEVAEARAEYLACRAQDYWHAVHRLHAALDARDQTRGGGERYA